MRSLETLDPRQRASALAVAHLARAATGVGLRVAADKGRPARATPRRSQAAPLPYGCNRAVATESCPGQGAQTWFRSAARFIAARGDALSCAAVAFRSGPAPSAAGMRCTPGDTRCVPTGASSPALVLARASIGHHIVTARVRRQQSGDGGRHDCSGTDAAVRPAAVGRSQLVRGGRAGTRRQVARNAREAVA
jgi:hypothetical protein